MDFVAGRTNEHNEDTFWGFADHSAAHRIEEYYEDLDEERQAQFGRLVYHDKSQAELNKFVGKSVPLTKDQWQNLSRARVNAFERNTDDNQTAYAVSAEISMINHSCRPNACWKYNAGKCEVHALDIIPAGQEITIAYSSHQEHTLCNTTNRRKHLLAVWNFTCNCTICTSRAEDRDRAAALVLYQRVQNDLEFPAMEISSSAQSDLGRNHECRLHRLHAGAITDLETYIDSLKRLNIRDVKLVDA